MTDVNIATHLLSDAHQNEYDVAILVTGDADQRPAIERVRKTFGKRVVICFSPSRKSYDLQAAADATFSASEKCYRKSQFPQVVALDGEHTIEKPAKWIHGG